MTTVYVNGERLKPADVDEHRNRMLDVYREELGESLEDAELNERLERDAVDNAIDALLLRQAAAAAEMEVTDREVKHGLNRLQQRMVKENPGYAGMGIRLASDPVLFERYREQLLADKYVAQLEKDVPRPTDEACREVFNRAPEEFVIPERVQVSHILQPADTTRSAPEVFADMLNIRQALVDGADFAEVARVVANDPDEDGQLGFIARGTFPPAFDRVVFALEVGAISEVFTTEYGHHIARVSDRRPEEARSFSTVCDLIREELWEAQKRKHLNESLDAMREAAEIRYDEAPD